MNNPREKYIQWLKKGFDNALKFNRLFQVTAFCAAIWFSYVSKKQSVEIENLAVSNAYLLSQNRSNAKAVNETPLAWWKKEYFPERHEILMQDYNDAFFEYMMKPLGLNRFDYVRQPDQKFFPEDVARVFFMEDFQVYMKYMQQDIDSTGHRPIYIEEFGNHWVDLLGNVNKDGYWRWAVELDGHFFIYGMLKRPRPGKKIKIVMAPSPFLKPKAIQITKKEVT